MSAKYQQQVWHTDVPAPLKLTALALADFAADDGTRIFPSVERLAWLTGKAERQVRSDLKHLRELGVLVPVTRTRVHERTGESVPAGGRGATTHYRMDLSVLPSRQTFAPSLRPRKGAVDCTLKEAVNDAKGAVDCTLKEGVNDIKGCSGTYLKGAVDCTRSPSDPPVRTDRTARTAAAPPTDRREQQKEEEEENDDDLRPSPAATDDAAGPPSSTVAATPTALSRAPAPDGNYRVILKLAHTVIDETGICDPTNDDLVEALKRRCAQAHVDYGADPTVAKDVVDRALHCACTQRVLNLRVNGNGHRFTSVGSLATALREADPAEQAELLNDLRTRASRGAAAFDKHGRRRVGRRC